MRNSVLGGDSFQLRLFDLDSAGCLSYYNSPAEKANGPNSKKQINIAGARVKSLGYDGKLYSFEVTATNGNQITMGLDTPEEANAWMEGTQNAAAYHGVKQGLAESESLPVVRRHARKKTSDLAEANAETAKLLPTTVREEQKVELSGTGAGSTGNSDDKKEDKEELTAEGTALPSDVTLRFLNPAVVKEETTIAALVSMIRPRSELATDVVLGTPHGYKFGGPTVISIPLKTGPAQVKQVMHKADDDAQWVPMDDQSIRQRNAMSCQVTVSELCYFAVLKDPSLKEGFLDKKLNHDGSTTSWEKQFFVAETPFLKFTGRPGDKLFGVYDLREFQIMPSEAAQR